MSIPCTARRRLLQHPKCYITLLEITHLGERWARECT